MTNTLNTPAEAIEMQYPLRVRRFERAAGTGGAGRHRGGDGIRREIEALAPCGGTLLGDRRLTRPCGRAGAGAGAAARDEVRRAGGRVEPLSGKSRLSLLAGDVLSIGTPGGGGFGPAENPLAPPATDRG
jgi:N-methylhydantoinase B/oxoprolinase/acetone carboxylase alpha subunit